VVSLLVHNLFVRIPVSLACWAWSVWGKLSSDLGSGKKLMISINELLQWYWIRRGPNPLGSLSNVSILFRTRLDDYDSVTISMHYQHDDLILVDRRRYHYRIIYNYGLQYRLRAGMTSRWRRELY
jgi:hypothetical protein